MPRLVLVASLISLGVVLAGCGGPDTAAPDAVAKMCAPNPSAPTYAQLFTRYFAPGTPGHCATAGCHADPNHNIWLCGTTKDSCYRGMVEQGLINPANPLASLIIDPVNSPLRWFNPNGPMPFDNQRQFPEGRDAIQSWVEACAQNN
jgi:hypothetical protein